MPQRRAVPAIVRPHGLSDAADGTNSFPGAMRALMNLIPDPTTSDVWVPRPPATLATIFPGFTTPGFVSAELVIGNTVYGMIASGRNAGKDEPFVYNLLTNTFTTVSGITSGNTPTSPATTGDWTPPIMARVAGRIIVTHPGFPGDQTKFGWFDISGFDEVVIGDVVTGSPVMTGNPSIFGIQPGMALSGVGGGGTVLQVANAYTGIAFTGDSHTTNTIDNITSTTGMFVGMIVTGPGIQGPTTIAQIIGGTSILLSRPATSSTTAGSFFVAAPGPTSADGAYSGTQTVGSPTITLASTVGLWVGQLISGNGIPLGSTIVSLVANTSITISQNVTAGGVQPFNVTGAVIVIDTAMGSTFDGMPAIVTGGTVAAPQWGAGDTQVNNLPSTPVGVAQMNGRAWFACGTDGIVFSDSGIPCQISNSPRVQALTTGDGLAVTAIGPQTLASLLGGQVQALIAFEGTNRMQQITGDPETNNLAMNALPVQTGTQAPLTLSNCEFGLSFVSPEGLRFITPAGTVSDPVGDAGMGITVPFIYSVVPSRMCAATNSHTIRITTQNGNKSGNPQEEYWFDLGRKVWCGPHTSTASLIQGWGADNFVMTFVGVDAALYVSSGVPTTSVDWLERGNPLMWWYMPVLQPDNLEVEMNAVVDMLLMCGGPDCDPLAAPEALIYSPTSNGSPPILPPFVTARAPAMTLANATLSATGTQLSCPTYISATGLTPLVPTGASFAYDVSQDGTIIVGHSLSNAADSASSQPVVWTESGGTFGAPVQLPLDGADTRGFAQCCTGDGSTIFGMSAAKGAKWVSGTLTLLFAQIDAGTTTWTVQDCTPDGSVVVGSENATDGVTHPVKWSGSSGAVTVLDMISGGTGGEALAVSDNGQIIVGYCIDASGRAFPCSWSGTTGAVTLLANGGDGSSNQVQSSAQGISADGTIIVGTITIGGLLNASKWVDGIWSDLGSLMFAQGISPDGLVVGGDDSSGAFGADIPGVWCHSNTIAHIPSLDVGVAGSFARRFSLDNLTIVGEQDSVTLGAVACYWKGTP